MSAGRTPPSRANYITVHVPAPVAGFSANVTSGTAPLPVSFIDLSSGSPTGRAWFFGDENYTQPWTEVIAGAGWSGRSYQSSVVLPDGSIVLIGGIDNGGSDKTDVWRSTDKGATWTEVNANPGWTIRGDQSSVVLPDGSIVTMGGGYNDTWRSSDNGATWTEVNASAGWTGRSYLSSVALPDGSIVILGGNAYPGWDNDVWRSTDDGATWIEMTAGAEWAGRYSQSAVAMADGSIVVIGGVTSSGYANDVWRSTDMGATWTEMTARAGWSARYSQSSFMLPDGNILTIGGENNDVWRLDPIGSSEQNPAHTYTSAGNYTVTLQAYNSGGFNSTRITGYVNVTRGAVAPAASFTANATSGTAPLDVSFTDTSTGSPTAWNWSFGDGNYSEEQTPVHTYESEGTYTVSLNATNAVGSDTVTETDYISVLQAAPDLVWEMSLGGSSIDNANSIVQTSDGGYIVAGDSFSTDGNVTGNHGGNDDWIVKLDSVGVISWQKSLGGSDIDTASSIAQTSDGGYIVAGSSASTNGDVTGNHGNTDYWIVKLDSTGAISWQKSLGGSSGDIATSIAQTVDGGYIVAGYTQSKNGDVTGYHDGGTYTFDYWIVKLDSTGAITWKKCLGGSAQDEANSIVQTSDGGYIIARLFQFNRWRCNRKPWKC